MSKFTQLVYWRSRAQILNPLIAHTLSIEAFPQCPLCEILHLLKIIPGQRFCLTIALVFELGAKEKTEGGGERETEGGREGGREQGTEGGSEK